MTDLTTDQIRNRAAEAYIYAFPMMMGYRFGYGGFVELQAPSYRGSLNQIHGEAVTLDHTFKDVITPNADTPYSMAMLDLRAEPLELHVPDVRDRYYVMQFIDLYGTNPHYVGSRATGSGSGSYLLVGPQWQGDGGGGFDGVLRFDTDLVYLIGRSQLLGADDVPALATIMDAYRLEPLSQATGTPPPAAAPTPAWPAWNDEASRDARFIGYLNFILGFCRPTLPDEQELMARMATIGVGPGLPFDPEGLAPETRQAYEAGVALARQQLAEKVAGLGVKSNGWSSASVFGDSAFYAGDYLLRGAAAMAGWGGNDAIEAFYPTSHQDAAGELLDSANRYEVTLASRPPVRAFWSVTMYDTSYDGVAGYLVDNSINRYLINSNTVGLALGEDGSLTIHIQRDRPDDPKAAANWLPAPQNGPFYLVLRMYWPEPAALDGSWPLPPVRRVD